MSDLIIRKAELDDFKTIYELNKEFAILYDALDKFTLTEEQLKIKICLNVE